VFDLGEDAVAVGTFPGGDIVVSHGGMQVRKPGEEGN
jgi:hypothetical protein